ncbi:MAG TPA: DNA topoisomerase, partial [Kineosporiaceae bacterium]|nr:DNA topoisomerase [Kineosporiaceae bacterium]
TYTLTSWGTRAQVDAVVAVLAGQAGRVVSCETSVEASAPPRLFDLTGLQQAANRVYGLSAARTLAAAQACYETHKILTYPRTDSCYITRDMAAGIPAVVTATATADPGLAGVAAAIAGRLSAGQDPVARLVNDAKVTDHHAIIPTLNSDLSGVDQDARRIYDLVARRFLAALLPAATFTRRTLLAAATGSDSSAHVLRATSRTRTSAGWQDVFPGPGIGKKPGIPDPAGGEPVPGEQQELLPDLPVGTPVRVTSCEPVAKKTAPPAAFTDASLLGAMATAGKLVTDDELAEAMKLTGLGTPATRAATIERLIKVGYLERRGRAIRATSKGIGVITVLGEHPLVHPDLTGSWEARLRAMEATAPGTEIALRDAFLADVRTFTGQVTGGIVRMDQTGFTTRQALGPCPIAGCGGQVVERSKSWSCDSWVSKEEPGCGYAIWKQAAGRRVTKAQAKKQLAAAAPTLPPPAQAVVVAPCPLPGCGGSIIARARAYSCDSWTSASQPGCGYVLWKTSKNGTDLSEQAARDLISRGVSQAKPAAEVICPCPAPRCKGSIVEKDRSFSCNSWRPNKKGCGTVVWKTDRAGNVAATRENLPTMLAQAVPAPTTRSPSKPSRRRH